MKVGVPVMVRASYLGTSAPERIDGVKYDTMLVRVAGSNRPIRVPAAHVETADRSNILITAVDFDLDRPRFAKTVRRLRQASNVSQYGLAERIGVTQKTVSKWERGEATPRSDRLVRLAAALGVSVSDILEGTDGVAA